MKMPDHRESTGSTFRAMGCPITITAVGAGRRVFGSDLVEIVRLAEAWETLFSRFRVESELSLLNRQAGRGSVVVGAELFAMVERAVEAGLASEGLYSPLVLGAVRHAGYDRDFAALAGTVAKIGATSGPVPSLDAIALDRGQHTVALAESAGIDLGGIAKGAFIDAVVERYREEWPGGCVNAGGDVRVWGEPPDGRVWTVGIEYPQHPELDIAQACLIDLDGVSAVATSGRTRRRWQTDRGPAHHLIDPSTGSWVTGSIEAATAFAPDAVSADLAAKTLFISISTHQVPALGSASCGLTIDDRGFAALWKSNDCHHVEINSLIARVVEAG
jgi:thiamine biosynthesis lipoprotein